MLLGSSIAMLGLASCTNVPSEGVYSDLACTKVVGEVSDNDFFTGYELDADNELYLVVDPTEEIDDLSISWNVPMDIGIIASVEALGVDGNFKEVATIYPSNTFQDFKSYEFAPVKTSVLRLKLSKGIARVNEIEF